MKVRVNRSGEDQQVLSVNNPRRYDRFVRRNNVGDLPAFDDNCRRSGPDKRI